MNEFIASLCCVLLMNLNLYVDERGADTFRNPEPNVLNCSMPAPLKPGDKIALVSQSYYIPFEKVQKAADVLRRWGFKPVIAPHVGEEHEGIYSGTLSQRLSDVRWALRNPEIKAILCNRGGYGAIQLVDLMESDEFSKNSKWLVGYSDVTTLLGMESCAGVMSIHGAMSSTLSEFDGMDTTSTLMRDLLLGKIPRYNLPPHPNNRRGHAQGILVGGNLCTFSPLLGSNVDVTKYDDIILFIEEVGESMHNIDRLFNMLKLQGVLSHCRGVVLGQFTDCGKELGFSSNEEMLSNYLKEYGIPVLCGFPAGHGEINLPLVMGAPVTMDVRKDGATLTFNIEGEQRDIYTDGLEELAREAKKKR